MEEGRHGARSHLKGTGRSSCTEDDLCSVRPLRRPVQLLLGAVAIVAMVVLALPWGGAGGSSLATPGPARAGDPVAPHALYVVQPGDTLWTIAQRLAPRADPRVIASELSTEVASDTVVPGERLVLP